MCTIICMTFIIPQSIWSEAALNNELWKYIHNNLESQVANHKTVHRRFSCGTHTLQHRCRRIFGHLPWYLVLDNCFCLDIFTSLFVDYEFRNFNVNLKLVFDLYRVQVNIFLTSLIETFIKVWNSNLIIIFLESISKNFNY
jgi:hypothetical protein